MTCIINRSIIYDTFFLGGGGGGFKEGKRGFVKSFYKVIYIIYMCYIHYVYCVLVGGGGGGGGLMKCE